MNRDEADEFIEKADRPDQELMLHFLAEACPEQFAEAAQLVRDKHARRAAIRAGRAS